MEEWKEYKVAEVIEDISMGPFGSNIKTLQSREFIRRIGSDKTGHWEIIRKEEGV